MFPWVVVVYRVREYAAAKKTISPRQGIRIFLINVVEEINRISPARFSEGGALILIAARINNDRTIDGEYVRRPLIM